MDSIITCRKKNANERIYPLKSTSPLAWNEMRFSGGEREYQEEF